MQYMLEVNDSEQLIKLCKALSSPARLKIVQLLAGPSGHEPERAGHAAKRNQFRNDRPHSPDGGGGRTSYQ